MKSKFVCLAPGLVLGVAVLSTVQSRAVEGGLGRSISGATIAPYAGLIPPAPGLIVGIGEMYYDGSIHGGKTTPIGGNLALNLELKASFTPIALAYIWDTGTTKWNLASSISIPFVWMEAQADVTAGSRVGRVKQDKFGLFDISVTPVTASYHITPTDHVAFSFNFWAPTGEYRNGDLAQLSLNNWTFIPGLAYTKILPGPNLELSAAWHMEFYTKNEATDYQTGDVSVLELLALKRFKCGAGFGIIGSWIEQVTDDSGPTADKLNGFSGHAFGVGPIATYSQQIGKSHLDLGIRWTPQFATAKQFEGNLFMFTAGWKF
jgi:hypothetical protein